MYISLREKLPLFSKVAVSFAFPPAAYKCSVASHPCPHFIWLVFLIFAILVQGPRQSLQWGRAVHTHVLKALRVQDRPWQAGPEGDLACQVMKKAYLSRGDEGEGTGHILFSS